MVFLNTRSSALRCSSSAVNLCSASCARSTRERSKLWPRLDLHDAIQPQEVALYREAPALLPYVLDLIDNLLQVLDKFFTLRTVRLVAHFQMVNGQIHEVQQDRFFNALVASSITTLTLRCGRITLQLNSCKLTDDAISTLARALQGIKTLTLLSLMSNPLLSDVGIAKLTECAAKTQLESLELADTGLTPRGTKRLLTALAKSRVAALDLCSNNLGDEGAFAIAEAVGACPHLKHLVLTNKAISDAGAAALLKTAVVRCRQ
ncbi:hypothetical protein AC1031_021263 [Aphanomyces cochlioides]|nr:hypothetical protein AC1031_021263 [Aphanomyces cochlioides]